MSQPFLNIVLYEPEIPSNTGSIGRTCVCTDSHLHLIEPLGFDISEKQVTRSGLDYWKRLNLSLYKNWDDFLDKHKSYSDRFFFFTTKSQKWFYDVSFKEGDYLIFGPETTGLPERLLKTDLAVTIPMGKGGRSYNLSNCVAIASCEVMRQLGPR